MELIYEKRRKRKNFPSFTCPSASFSARWVSIAREKWVGKQQKPHNGDFSVCQRRIWARFWRLFRVVLVHLLHLWGLWRQLETEK